MVMTKVGQVWRRLCIVSCLLLTGLVFSGCQTDNANKPDSNFSAVPGIETVAAGGTAPASQVGTMASTNTASGTNQPSSEIIKSGEVLVITFADLPPPPMPAFDQRVRDDGTITLIHNHVFQAAGKRVGDLEREIHDFYVPRYYINLTVTVRNSPERFYYVGGEVRLPNKLPWVNGITVTKAIASAGGFTDFANKRSVKLIRADGKKQTINFNKVLDHPELDPLVFPDDRIHVSRTIW